MEQTSLALNKQHMHIRDSKEIIAKGNTKTVVNKNIIYFMDKWAFSE
jgi:hypothetical protein